MALVRLASEEKGNITSETLRLSTSSEIDVRLGNADWQRNLTEDANSSDDPLFTSTAKPLEVPLVMKLTRPLLSLTTVVNKTWVQSWLTNEWRHDRAVFQLTTSENEIEFKLPAYDQSKGLMVAVDGQVVNPSITESKLVRIATSAQGEPTNIVVEFSYVVPLTHSSLGMIDCEFPRPANSMSTSFFRWQLKMAGDEHLVRYPNNLTPELTWRWHNFCWDRQSALSQHDLEQWTGASQQSAIAEDSTNQYVCFSTAFGDVAQTEIRGVAHHDRFDASRAYYFSWPRTLLMYVLVVQASAVARCGGDCRQQWPTSYRA